MSKGGEEMSSTKDTVVKVKNLEKEKRNLLTQFEELRKMADLKSKSLENEISAIKDQMESLREIMGQERNQVSNDNSFGQENHDLVMRLVERIIDESNKLGNQIFEFSPYSQYFDGWLVNLEQIISEFESNVDIKLDDLFIKDRSRIFLDIERTLAQKRLEESKQSTNEKTLNDSKQLLVEIEKDYEKQTKETYEWKNSEIPRLNNRIRELEYELESHEEIKSKIPKPLATMSKPLAKMSKQLSASSRKEWNEKRKQAEEKFAQTKQDLVSTKNELGALQQKFIARQEALKESYEKKKQDVMETVVSLQNDLEKIKTDTSINARREASAAIVRSINALIQRTTK